MSKDANKDSSDALLNFTSKLDQMRIDLGDDIYGQFIKRLTPDILANPDLFSDLLGKAYATRKAKGESDE